LRNENTSGQKQKKYLVTTSSAFVESRKLRSVTKNSVTLRETSTMAAKKKATKKVAKKKTMKKSAKKRA
jgi:hypothetical protein